MFRTLRSLVPASLSIGSAAVLATLVLTVGQTSDAGRATSPSRHASTTQPTTPAAVAPAAFDPAKVALSLSPFAAGFESPLLVTNAHDGTNRLYVVEQAGRIRVVDPAGKILSTLLDLRGAITSGGERGLLGLAFDPHFPVHPYIYVNFTDRNGNTAISRYTISNGVAVRSTGVRILTIGQPYENHNGGNIAFGPDGFLYIGMGDGGSAGDPQNRAQNLSSLLGKMLRIDIHHGTRTNHYVAPASNPYVGRLGNDLIWSRGLRNPWRWSFDSATGALWIGDVGQGSWEEIDRAAKSGSTPAGRGVNYGWPAMEGRACYRPSSGCSTGGKRVPVSVFGHDVSGDDNCSVTGGYVYRGSASPVLVGGYVFGDFCSGRIWTISADAAAPAAPTPLLDTSLSISSFGLDEAGELYVTDLAGGGIYRVSATAKP